MAGLGKGFGFYSWEGGLGLWGRYLVEAVTRVKPYICTMPLRMDEGWNTIQLNLADFTRRAYGTNYVETLRVKVHANCRLRRIYFSDRLYSEEELPPEFKLYLPMQKSMMSLSKNNHFWKSWPWLIFMFCAFPLSQSTGYIQTALCDFRNMNNHKSLLLQKA
ncbi:Cilia- and flagella-associated protein 20 [Vitis vinifera]|uniref:Cilia-and flagella-associated protein 20 n=1 Tax=Vitis vinifera TaxID=29760 RepID=A0A438FTQ5_VITVI|nr:Cilia- and flagella-associated protein 20 [Vitis vinifera]